MWCPTSWIKRTWLRTLVRLQMRAITPIEERVLVTVEDQNGEVVAKKAEAYARPGEILTLAIKPQAFVKQFKKRPLNLLLMSESGKVIGCWKGKVMTMAEISEIICVTCPQGCVLKVKHEGKQVLDVLETAASGAGNMPL
jgi:hypothetical protein